MFLLGLFPAPLVHNSKLWQHRKDIRVKKPSHLLPLINSTVAPRAGETLFFAADGEDLTDPAFFNSSKIRRAGRCHGKRGDGPSVACLPAGVLCT